MKKIYLFAAAAALFAACQGDELAVDEQQQAQLEEGAVGFEAYTQRAVTRSGTAGDMTLDALKNNATGNFGVFGYYTDNRDYDQLAVPNFFYNQKIEWDGTNSVWKYEPLKYWPNEYGDNAISDDQDKVTFFAYAPWVTLDAAGKAEDQTYGITSMTRNTTAGDPVIKYIASFDNKYAVDLLWGVCQQSDWALVQGGQAQEITVGKPWINVQRPAGVDQRLKFQFRHALSKLQIKVNHFTDGYTNANPLDGKTKIWIRSVRLTGFTMKGALNLNNEKENEPYWLNYNGIGDLVADGDVIIYDGRKDGKEAVAGAEATNEKSKGLNSQFIEDENQLNGGSAWVTTPAAKVHTGVTATLTNLFEKSDGSVGDYFYVIPTGDPMQIEIVYDVETISANLGVHLADNITSGSSIENRITKSIKFGDDITTLQAGKAYEINLHLGMNSVKFDAEVVDWDKMASPDIDLPSNMPEYAVNATTPAIDVPGAETVFYFAVTGLKGGESVTGATCGSGNFTSGTVTVSSTGNFGAADSRANASGVAYVKVSAVTKNNTILDVTTDDAIVITPAQSAEFKLDVTQKAQPLALQAPAGAPNEIKSDVSYQLRSSLDGRTLPADIPNWQANATGGTPTANITVWCDGAELTVDVREDDNAPADEATVTFNKLLGKLTFASARTPGQTIKVSIKAGDVPEETISFSIAKVLAFVPSTVKLEWRSTEKYDVSGYLKYITGAITWEQTGGTDLTTVGVVSITDLGSSTITATDNMTTGATTDDKKASLSLEIIKQPLVISGFVDPIVTDKTVAQLSSPAEITNAFSATANGKHDPVTASVGYTVTVEKGGVNVAGFTFNGSNELVAPSGLEEGTYNITVTATGTTTDTHYSEKSESKTFSFVVNP